MRNIKDIYILGEIVEYSTYEEDTAICASDIIRELVSVDPETEIHLHINSIGGSVYQAFTIASALKAHKGKVVGIVEGLAASAASIIAIGGTDELIMRPHSDIMIHSAWAYADGTHEDLRNTADHLESITNSIAGVYADKSGKSADYYLDLMKKDTYLTAEQALAEGLCDKIEDGVCNEMAFNAEKALKVMAKIRDEGGAKNMSVFKKHLFKNKEETMSKEENITKKGAEPKLEEPAEPKAEAPTEEAPKADEPKAEAPKAEGSETPSEPLNEEGGTDTPKEDNSPSTEPTDAVEAKETEEEAEAKKEEEPKAEFDVITLPIDVYNELVESAKAGAEKLANDREAEFNNRVDSWINRGKISAKQRKKVLNHIKTVESATEVYESIPDNTIPRVAMGTSKINPDPKDLLKKDQTAVWNNIQSIISRPKI